MSFSKPFRSGTESFGENTFNSFRPPIKNQNLSNKPYKELDEDKLLRELESRRVTKIANQDENRNTFKDVNFARKKSSHEINDPGVKDLLGQIDALMDRIGGSNNQTDNYMIQTGNFASTNNINQSSTNHFNQDNQSVFGVPITQENKFKSRSSSAFQIKQSRLSKVQPPNQIAQNKQLQQLSSSSESNSSFNSDKKRRKNHLKSKRNKSKKKQQKSSSSSSSQSSSSSPEKYHIKNKKSQQSQKQSQTPNKVPLKQSQIQQNTNLRQQQQTIVPIQQSLKSNRTYSLESASQHPLPEVFCVSCEEFINVAKVDDHCRFCQGSNRNLDLKQVNDKLIKINYIRSRKVRGLSNQNIIRASAIVDECVNRIILVNDSVDQLTRLVGDLNIIKDQILQIIPDRNNEDMYVHALQTLTIKLQEFSTRKLTIVQELMVSNQSMKYQSQQQQNPYMSSTKNFNSTTSKVEEDYYVSRKSFVSNVQSNSIFQPVQKQSIIIPQATTVVSLTTNNIPQPIIINTIPIPLNSVPSKKKLFQQSNQQSDAKRLSFNSRTNSSTTFMGASKARCIENNQKENSVIVVQNQNYESSFIQNIKPKQGLVQQQSLNQDIQPIQLFTSPQRKEGIILGNDNLKQKTQIILPSPKKSEINQSQINQSQINHLPIQKSIRDYDYQYVVSKKNSIISGISGFLSKISIIPSAPPIVASTEAQKKKFFDLAVKKKNELHSQHPAQEVLIAEIYDKCRCDNIPEDQWNNWISNLYSQQ